MTFGKSTSGKSASDCTEFKVHQPENKVINNDSYLGHKLLAMDMTRMKDYKMQIRTTAVISTMTRLKT